MELELIPTVDIARLKESLIWQMSRPVRWRAVSLSLATQGMKEVVEIGPGRDLIKQMKRICPELTFTNFSNLSQVQKNVSLDRAA